MSHNPETPSRAPVRDDLHLPPNKEKIIIPLEAYPKDLATGARSEKRPGPCPSCGNDAHEGGDTACRVCSEKLSAE